jgi:hypothetical protein
MSEHDRQGAVAYLPLLRALQSLYQAFCSMQLSDLLCAAVHISTCESNGSIGDYHVPKLEVLRPSRRLPESQLSVVKPCVMTCLYRYTIWSDTSEASVSTRTSMCPKANAGRGLSKFISNISASDQVTFITSKARTYQRNE